MSAHSFEDWNCCVQENTAWGRDLVRNIPTEWNRNVGDMILVQRNHIEKHKWTNLHREHLIFQQHLPGRMEGMRHKSNEEQKVIKIQHPLTFKHQGYYQGKNIDAFLKFWIRFNKIFDLLSVQVFESDIHLSPNISCIPKLNYGCISQFLHIAMMPLLWSS